MLFRCLFWDIFLDSGRMWAVCFPWASLVVSTRLERIRFLDCGMVDGVSRRFSVGFTGSSERILFPDSGTVDRVHSPREWRITIIVSHTISLLAVQWLLRKFTGQTIGPLNEIICPNPGAAYSLGFANCQDCAKFVITSLEDYNWTEIHRLSQPFSLSLLEKKMLFELEKEAEGRDIHKYRRAGLLLTDERWWTTL